MNIDVFYHAADKLHRSLMRHRERYVRAWIATYGIHPADAKLVTTTTWDGTTVRTTIHCEFKEGVMPGTTCTPGPK